MASGKTRTRRSPGNSYSSTITTVIFVALSVLGIWLLTSNTLAPPQSTTRPSNEHISTPHIKPDQPQTEDRSISQDIIEDTVKIDDTVLPESGNDNADVQETTSTDSGEDDKQEVQQAEVEEQKVDQEETTENSSSQGKENVQEREVKEPVQEKEVKEHVKEKKQVPSETQKQEVEQKTEKKPKVEEKVTETSQEESTAENTENQISDADQQKRLEQQQQQETAQVQKTPQTKQNTNDEGSTTVKEAPKTTAKKADNTFPNGDSTGIPKESKESKKSWATQVDQSEDQKERRKDESPSDKDNTPTMYNWLLCNETAGADFIPCLDNEKGIAKIRHRNHYEHRERHCPEQPPTCLVPMPQGYKTSIEWPISRDKIWYHNVPHTLLAEVKGHQNWVKVTGEFLTFPGGGTQFIHGALHYIDFIQEAVPDIAWGKHTRVILDVGCGVASFGGYLFERDVLAMSFAPKDEHEAQVQFALERGIPAISAVMGTQRLPFPSRVFDVVHCARCRVPWHADGGALLLELNRVLRPGGYFLWSATPVYQTLEEDVQIWQAMSNLTVAMCWELVTIKKDKLNSVGVAIFHKPITNDCYEQRKNKVPPMCKLDDDPNAAWYVPLQSCMHRVPVEEKERGSQWPELWPKRVQTPPYWLDKSQMGIYGRPAPDDFASDYNHWTRVVSQSYMSGLGINWTNVRNIMDMRAVYGGFAAALKDLKVWVMNVVNVDEPDTLPIIYERGLFGIYHDWCESFSTYPRTYDLLHADHLFSKLKKRCKLEAVLAEVDRIARPGGKLIVRDESNMIGEVENLLKSLHWEVHLTFSKNHEGILSAQKSNWRPETYAPRS